METRVKKRKADVMSRLERAFAVSFFIHECHKRFKMALTPANF
ncbi:hypothetical protein QUF89_13335 [Peribacillus simplex]|uniref:Uncharacterized protein n=1 Tax=Peribacillus simplex TaxID=1478 RepID=A0AAW7ING3_9BACI|nr:hypothetical protein [Peribacillus simplex]